MRDRLIDLLHDSDLSLDSVRLADHLIANGVVILDPKKYPPVTNRGIIDSIMGMPLDEMAELIQAKQEGRIIVLPCKVGDVVYYINTQYHMALYRNTIYEAKVVRIVATSLGVVLVIHIRDESGCCEIPDVKDFGKTVFLTREEAEKALAEREAKP